MLLQLLWTLRVWIRGRRLQLIWIDWIIGIYVLRVPSLRIVGLREGMRITGEMLCVPSCSLFPWTIYNLTYLGSTLHQDAARRTRSTYIPDMESSYYRGRVRRQASRGEWSLSHRVFLVMRPLSWALQEYGTKNGSRKTHQAQVRKLSPHSFLSKLTINEWRHNILTPVENTDFFYLITRTDRTPRRQAGFPQDPSAEYRCTYCVSRLHNMKGMRRHLRRWWVFLVFNDVWAEEEASTPLLTM